MYMAPIVAAKPAVAAPGALLARRAIGAPLAAVAIMAMVAWLALVGTWSATILAARGLIAGPRLLLQFVDTVGGYALGR